MRIDSGFAERFDFAAVGSDNQLHAPAY